MDDRNLQALMNRRAWIEQAEAGVGGGSDVLSPRYVRQAEAVRVAVQPLRGELAVTVAGKLPEATHVVYLEAGPEVRPGDVLAVEAVGAEQRYEVLCVEDDGGRGHHLRLVVG